MRFSDNPLPGVPAVESPLFTKLFGGDCVSAETRAIAERLQCDGFAVVDFPDPDFEQIAAVAAAKADPAKHWMEFAYRENRRWK